MSEQESFKGAMSFAEQLQWLYDHHPDPTTGRTFNDASLARRIGEVMPGFTVTSATLWNLRKGVHTNPSWMLVQGIAKAFGKTPMFFLEEPSLQRSEEEQAIASVVRRAEVRALLIRASDLPADSLKTIIQIVEQVRQAVLTKRRKSPEQKGSS